MLVRCTNGRCCVVPPPGVEPGTARVRAVCSGQLSYGGMATAVAVGDGGIGPPVLGRAPVLQTGHGTIRMSPMPNRGADAETRTPRFTGSRPAASTVAPRRRSDPAPPASRKPAELDVQVRTKSAMTDGTALSKPTTSSAPASSGSAIVKPLEVIPTTISLAWMPIFSRYWLSACIG